VGVADVNPLSHVVDASRELFNGELWSATVVRGTLVGVAVTVLAVLWGRTKLPQGCNVTHPAPPSLCRRDGAGCDHRARVSRRCCRFGVVLRVMVAPAMVAGDEEELP
jgi:hypothetical protein